MAVNHAHPTMREIAQMLGLPPKTRAFVLRCTVGEPVTVEVEYLPDPQVTSEPVRQCFRLEPVDGAQESDSG